MKLQIWLSVWVLGIVGVKVVASSNASVMTDATTELPPLASGTRWALESEAPAREVAETATLMVETFSGIEARPDPEPVTETPPESAPEPNRMPPAVVTPLVKVAATETEVVVETQLEPEPKPEPEPEAIPPMGYDPRLAPAVKPAPQPVYTPPAPAPTSKPARRSRAS